MESQKGVRFRPNDAECILYLLFKVTGDPLPSNAVVLDEFDPYDETELPRLFFSVVENGDLFFFTKLKRKGTRTGDSKNADRTVGNKGTWHGDQSVEVSYGRFGVIGTAHAFTYWEEGSSDDGRFLITEYHLPYDTSLQYDPLTHHVLCHLHVNNGKGNRGSSHQAAPSTKKHRNQAASSSSSSSSSSTSAAAAEM